jgi:hypothetical protein
MQLTQTLKRMNTKYNLIFAGLALYVVAASTGCKPDLQGELGEPFNKVEGMIGVWEMQSFSQTDLQSALKEVRDLSELYIDGTVTPLQITLNEDRSYNVSIEKGRNYFGEQGSWGLDDEEHPTFLILATLDVEGNPSDTLQYNLGSVVRPHDNVLDIVYDRPCDGDPVLAYTFSFNRM